jgi:hypothetical protein
LLRSGARVALVHGEEDKRAALAAKLAQRTSAPAWLPVRRDRVRLRKRGEPVLFEDKPARRSASTAP